MTEVRSDAWLGGLGSALSQLRCDGSDIRNYRGFNSRAEFCRWWFLKLIRVAFVVSGEFHFYECFVLFSGVSSLKSLSVGLLCAGLEGFHAMKMTRDHFSALCSLFGFSWSV